MTPADFQKLAREWSGRLRASGFRDIEAPSGQIKHVAVPAHRDAQVAHLESALEFLHRHRFSSPWEQEVWRLHAEGLSNRKIAKRVRAGRKRVEAALARLEAIRAKRTPPPGVRRGRPVDPDGFRSEGLVLAVRLLPAHVAALGQMRAVFGVGASEVVRRAVLELGRKTKTVIPEYRGQYDSAWVALVPELENPEEG